MSLLTPDKILVPIDFSERSEEAARYAASLAGHFASDLVFVHVLEPLQLEYSMIQPSRALFESALESLCNETRGRLASFASQFAGSSFVVAEGDPADQILFTAVSQRADLIVMPTQGRSRIRSFLIGSVTAKVLHDSKIPVWTGVHLDHQDTFPEFRVKNILCAVDLGPQTAAVLRSGAELAGHFESKLSIVHVVHQMSSTLAHEHLSALLRDIEMEADCLVECGEPHKVVSAKARRIGADLVIIGRGCANDIAGRLRAQAYGIVRQSPCPVLSV